MFADLQNNEKFYLKELIKRWYNYSSPKFHKLILTKYDAGKGKLLSGCFTCGKGGLSQRLDVRLM